MRKTLYHPEIIEHSKNPHHVGTIDHCTHSAEGYNQICGDYIKVDLNVEDGTLVDFKFTPECCAITKAAASMLGNKIIGKPISEAKTIELDAFSAFDVLKDFPARIKCATLPLATVRAALENKKETTTDDD